MTLPVIDLYIRFALNDADLKALIGERVWHLACPDAELNNYPYVVFGRDSLRKDSSKDGDFACSTDVTIMIVANSDVQLTDVTSALDAAMTDAQASWNATNNKPYIVAEQELNLGSETWDEHWSECTTTARYTIQTEEA